MSREWLLHKMMSRSEISIGLDSSIRMSDPSTYSLYSPLTQTLFSHPQYSGIALSAACDKADFSVRWIKAITILERASKLVLLDPEDSSEHTRQWNTYATTGMNKPPGYLESPRYRVPSEFEETKFALETLIQCCGEDGVFPVQKKVVAEMGGAQRLDISPAVILFVSPV